MFPNKEPSVIGRFPLLLSIFFALFITACDDGSRSSDQGSGTEKKKYALNDTGITWGANFPNGNNPVCIGERVETQDCSWGRDSNPATNDDSDGHAGFSFTKLDANGDPLLDQSVDYATQPWACVQDNVTGLTWEVKMDDDGLSDRDWTYYSYDSDYADGDSTADDSDWGTDEHWAGLVDLGIGSGSDNCANPNKICTTEQHVADINQLTLCGYSDWDMPTRLELRSIRLMDGSAPAIDTNWFPNASGNQHWSSSVKFYMGIASIGAWTNSYTPGHTDVKIYHFSRAHDYPVRLVRRSQ